MLSYDKNRIYNFKILFKLEHMKTEKLLRIINLLIINTLMRKLFCLVIFNLYYFQFQFHSTLIIPTIIFIETF
jgi:hypothetical protein